MTRQVVVSLDQYRISLIVKWRHNRLPPSCASPSYFIVSLGNEKYFFTVESTNYWKQQQYSRCLCYLNITQVQRCSDLAQNTFAVISLIGLLQMCLESHSSGFEQLSPQQTQAVSSFRTATTLMSSQGLKGSQKPRIPQGQCAQGLFLGEQVSSALWGPQWRIFQ